MENGNQHDSQRKNQEQAKEMVNDELNINKNQVIVVNSNCGLQALSSWKDQDTGENGASDNREQMQPVLPRPAVAIIPTQTVCRSMFVGVVRLPVSHNIHLCINTMSKE